MAETRSIRTILELEAGRFNQGIRQASNHTRLLTKDFGDLDKASQKTRRDLDAVGNVALGAGTTLLAGTGLAVKSALNWESAWAGVRKTVDGSDEDMKKLETSLRRLARTLPATHQEIALVAETAGQLGVSRENIADFTRTMIALGETTNLSANDAASALAKFANVMGTSQRDISRLGSSLVGLGNNFATTEADILGMAQRLSGSGKQFRLTEGDVLGLATAMSSVGIEAEAGGTAMSMVMRKIDTAVREGGESLDRFARVSGLSAGEFARAWNESPPRALTAFASGLNRAGQAGESMSSILDDLGIKGVRESDTMLKLASSHDQLARAIEMGNTEYNQNTALMEEALKRYETAESKIRVATNTIVDSGIKLGGALLPVLASTAEGVASVGETFARLPDPLIQSIGVFGAVAGGALLAGGAFIKLVPSIADTVRAFNDLKLQFPSFENGMGRAGKALKVFGGVLGAVTIATTLSNIGKSMTDFSISATELASSTERISRSGTPLRDMLEGMATPSELKQWTSTTKDFARELNLMVDPGLLGRVNDFGVGIGNLLGQNLATGDQMRERIVEYQRALVELSNVDLDAFISTVQSMYRELGGDRDTFMRVISASAETRDRLAEVAVQAGYTADEAGIMRLAVDGLPAGFMQTGEAGDALSESLYGVSDSAKEAARASDELFETLFATADQFLAEQKATRAYNEALEKATDTLGRNTTAFSENSKAGREASVALEDVAERGLKMIEVLSQGGANRGELLTKLADDIRRVGVETGRSDAEISDFLNNLGLLPDQISTAVNLDAKKAMTDADYLATTMDEWDNGVSTATMNIEAENAKLDLLDVKGMLEAMPNVTAYISGDTEALDTAIHYSKLELAVLAGLETVPLVGLDPTQLREIADTAEARLRELDGMRPTPEILAEKKVLTNAVNLAKAELGSIPGSRNTDIRATNGTLVASANTAKSALAGIPKTRNTNITATNGDALAKIGAVSGALASLAGRAINIGGVLPGRASGGWVPGSNPGVGVDNVLWPMKGKAGGGYLSQPLAGEEFVVNAKSAKQWGPLLEYINAGGQPVSRSNSEGARTVILRVGDRDFTAYISEVSSSVAGAIIAPVSNRGLKNNLGV